MPDKDTWLHAVGKDGMALQFAGKDLQNDVDVVRIAVQQNGMALQFASDDLKNDANIVQWAYAQNTNSSQYAADDVHEKWDSGDQYQRELDRKMAWLKKNTTASFTDRGCRE